MTGRAIDSRVRVVPISLDEANELVARWHRHSNPTVGHKFSIGLAAGDEMVGAAIIGRPVARMMDDGWTLEVLRCVTNGTPNACSKLYAASWRAARAMGYRRLITYTLKSESGASLRASGWVSVYEVSAASWHRGSRPRVDKHSLQQRLRWELETA